MKRVGRKLLMNIETGHTFFQCPGCHTHHALRIKGSESWGWNGSGDAPTFTPSVLVTHNANPDAGEQFKEWRTARVCHSFINDGQIQFLDDSTHTLTGKTVNLPDWPEGDAP